MTLDAAAHALRPIKAQILTEHMCGVNKGAYAFHQRACHNAKYFDLSDGIFDRLARNSG